MSVARACLARRDQSGHCLDARHPRSPVARAIRRSFSSTTAFQWTSPQGRHHDHDTDNTPNSASLATPLHPRLGHRLEDLT